MATNKKIIGLLGGKRTGKNTFASLLKKELEEKNLSVQIIALADPLKEILAFTLNTSPSAIDTFKEFEDTGNIVINVAGQIKTKTTVRKALQKLGESIKVYMKDDFVWCKMVLDKIDQSVADVIIITDLRLPYEIDFFKNQFGQNVSIIQIKRSTNLSDPHPTEVFPSSEEATKMSDIVIDNNGSVKDLKQTAKMLAEKIATGAIND